MRRLLWKFGLLTFNDVHDAATAALTPVDKMRLMGALRDQQGWWPLPSRDSDLTKEADHG